MWHLGQFGDAGGRHEAVLWTNTGAQSGRESGKLNGPEQTRQQRRHRHVARQGTSCRVPRGLRAAAAARVSDRERLKRSRKAVHSFSARRHPPMGG